MKLKQRHLHLFLIVLLLSCFFYGHVQLTSLRKASTTTTTTHGKVVTEFRRRRVHQAWNVSTPVFILSLPKSGTTSLARYFICGGIPTAHTHRFYNGSWYRLGDCFRQNVVIHEKHRPMLDGCGPYQVWSDLALEDIARDYPHATLLVSYRAAWKWWHSVQKWSNIVQRWIYHCPFFPNNTDATVWQAFYQQHLHEIRALVQRHSTLTLWEVNLEDDNIGQKLQTWTGISAECWGHCKPQTGECFYPV